MNERSIYISTSTTRPVRQDPTRDIKAIDQERSGLLFILFGNREGHCSPRHDLRPRCVGYKRDVPARWSGGPHEVKVARSSTHDIVDTVGQTGDESYIIRCVVPEADVLGFEIISVNIQR